jgi:histidinol-phosphatase (PHP family)
LLDAAVSFGFHTYGIAEHAPRAEARFLYPEEIELGCDVERIEADFDAYARESDLLAREFEGRLRVLRGFEIEVVPQDRYAELMQALRRKYGFDYVVGSVHHVDDESIDGPKAEFEALVQRFGSLERLAVRYYQLVAEMVYAVRPEVVGHLDLVRKNAPLNAELDTPLIRRAAEAALDAVAECNAILDLNTAGYRKGLGTPYPAPWLVRAANERDLAFCFGDDSHSPSEVGAGVDEARHYLIENGVTSIAYWVRQDEGLRRETASLV